MNNERAALLPCPFCSAIPYTNDQDDERDGGYVPDDCDKSYFDRCGLKVVTDNKAGKQYLLLPYGGIIERETTPLKTKG